MKKDFFISVIIPVYNAEKYLAEAINSVLQQTYQPLEIIVVDDESTDKSAEVAQSFGDVIRYEFQKNNGAAKARNTGINLAKGDYLTFLDADDLWTENKLKLQVQAFNNHPELDMVFGYVKQFHSSELTIEEKRKILCPTDLMAGYIPGAMMIKKESFLAVGKFAKNWQVGEFIDWYLKAQEKGLQSLLLSEIFLKRRLHKSNMGIRQRDERLDYVRIMKASLDRRRASKKIK